MNLQDMKNKLIAKVKNYYSEQVILPTYPYYKQINLTNGVEDDDQELSDMIDFISAKRLEIDAIETAVNALENTSIHDDFVTGNDETMKTFVVNHLAGLTTDDQKIAVVVALQNIV